MARKKKYNETFPDLVEGYAKEGLNDEQIAEKLGIATSTYYDYQLKYSEFSEAIKRGKKPIDSKVENALLKRALGYDYEEKHTEIRIDENGNPKPAMIKTVKRHIAPDTGAIAFWLKNRKPIDWSDKRDINLSTKPTIIFQDISKK